MSDRLKDFKAPEMPKGVEPSPAPVADANAMDAAAQDNTSLPAQQPLDVPSVPVPEVKGPQSPDERRAEMIKRITQQRDAELDGSEPTEQDAIAPPFARTQPQPDVQAQQQQPEADQRKAEPENNDTSTFTLNIRGKRRDVTRQELLGLAELSPEEANGMSEATIIRIAQKQAASTEYLAEARSIVNDARRSARGDGQHQPGQDIEPQHQGDDEDDQPKNERQLSREASRTIENDPIEDARLVQFGTPEEAAAALERIAARAADRKSFQDAEKAIAKDVETALDNFRTTNADISDDPDLARLFTIRTMDDLKEELSRSLKIPRERVDATITTPELAGQAYREARAKGYPLPTPEEILSRSATHIRTRFLGGRLPAPQPAPNETGQQARLAMKQALPQQPSRVGAPVPQAQPSNDGSVSTVVQQMRKARGLSR